MKNSNVSFKFVLLSANTLDFDQSKIFFFWQRMKGFKCIPTRFQISSSFEGYHFARSCKKW